MTPRTLTVVSFVAAAVLIPIAASAADPTTPECLSANENSIQLQADGKLKAAGVQALVCASVACPAEVRAECERRVTDIAAAMPSILFEVRDAAGNDLVTVTVTMDGQPFASRLGGSPVELDPGPHAFTFEADGKKVERSFVIREGDRGRRERIVFQAPAGTSAVAPSAAAPAGNGAGVATPVPSQDTGMASSTWSTQKTLAVVAGGVGAVALVVGTILGVSASSKWSQAKSDCGAGCGPNDPAQQERNDAGSSADVSTVAFIAGGVFVAAGAVLWLTAPSGAATPAGVRVAPTMTGRSGGLSLEGWF